MIILSKRSETAAHHLDQLLLKKYQAPVSGQKLFGETHKKKGHDKKLLSAATATLPVPLQGAGSPY